MILDAKQLQQLNGMRTYWREVFRREGDQHHIFVNECRAVLQMLSPETVLRIIDRFMDFESDMPEQRVPASLLVDIFNAVRALDLEFLIMVLDRIPDYSGIDDHVLHEIKALLKKAEV